MPRRQDAGSGALRGLVGAGPSQVGVVGALRARDVSRPTEDQVRAALATPEPVARNAPHHDPAAAGGDPPSPAAASIPPPPAAASIPPPPAE